jgi:hypothetical protein
MEPMVIKLVHILEHSSSITCGYCRTDLWDRHMNCKLLSFPAEEFGRSVMRMIAYLLFRLDQTHKRGQLARILRLVAWLFEGMLEVH